MRVVAYGVTDDREVQAVRDGAADRADLRRFPARHLTLTIKPPEQDRNKDSQHKLPIAR